MRVLTAFVLSLFFLYTSAQKKSAIVSGRVIDENEDPVAKVSVIILGNIKGATTNDSGFFNIKIPAEKGCALVFSHIGYKDFQKTFYLSENEEDNVIIRLEKNKKVLETVTVSDNKEPEVGQQKINPNNALISPTPTGGIEALIQTLVGSNNELTSQYSVRGGNYDENLVYINDFEIFRPYLVSNAQQEGLSLINPELAKNVNFYTGGFQAKYGDKMSSVLDIQYKKPKDFGGSVYISPLEQGFHLEGSSTNDKLTYLVGVRNKSNSSVLGSQETTGNYVPSSDDVQSYITYKLNQKWQLELLGIVSTTSFLFVPQTAQKSAAVFSPLFTEDLALDIYFQGQEKDKYSSDLIGFTAINQPNKKLKLKWMLSYFKDNEKQTEDIGANYLFGERDFDNTSSTYGQIVNPLGAGFYEDYIRDALTINVWNFSHKGSWDLDNGKHFVQWGATIEQTTINDKLYSWDFQDSAGYSLPVSTNPNAPFQLNSFINSGADLSIQKYSGYVQDNINLSGAKKDVIFQAGARFNYNSLNKQFLVSPRVQLSIKPEWNKDMVFKFATGIYDQPPFYREMVEYDGTINTAVKAQKSVQVVGGMDYNFKSSDRPFRMTTEAYYKHLWDVNPYDINNVSIQYFGTNNARAYAYGLETRFYGELIKDAESWLSIGLMHTMENINNFYYYSYFNKEGQAITAQTTDQTVADSVRTNVGWVRRPTDRALTVGLFLQDYLSTNQNFRVHLNIIYGTNMPYNIPGSVKYRDALTIEPYIRVDVGFSAILLDEKMVRRSHGPFNEFKSIIASLEIFNLIDRENIISYQLIKDFSNTVYAIPNRLTPRLLNFKIIGTF